MAVMRGWMGQAWESRGADQKAQSFTDAGEISSGKLSHAG
jgi:hypothetical protein